MLTKCLLIGGKIRKVLTERSLLLLSGISNSISGYFRTIIGTFILTESDPNGLFSWTWASRKMLVFGVSNTAMPQSAIYSATIVIVLVLPLPGALL
jgi:hypothetical protein